MVVGGLLQCGRIGTAFDWRSIISAITIEAEEREEEESKRAVMENNITQKPKSP